MVQTSNQGFHHERDEEHEEFLLFTDLAISVQNCLNKWTGLTGLCNPVNPVIFLVPATGRTRCRVSNFPKTSFKSLVLSNQSVFHPRQSAAEFLQYSANDYERIDIRGPDDSRDARGDQTGSGEP
jgi:hypothetical protein